METTSTDATSEPQVIIMRGVPGSGKTHWVQQLNKKRKEKRKEAYGAASADDYFIDINGHYEHFTAGEAEAHNSCFKRFMMLIDDGRRVIVNNTNIKLEHMAPYIAYATAQGLSFELVHVVTPLSRCIERSIHGVDKELITWMAEGFEEAHPWWPSREVQG